MEITESESIKDYEWISPIINEFREAAQTVGYWRLWRGLFDLEKLIAA